MTWHLKKVPKLIHFYWGNDKCSFYRFLSVYSFRKYNPDWIIKIHLPSVLGQLRPTWNTGEQGNQKTIEKDYFNELSKLNVQFIKHDFSKYGFNNSVHEVHKSDYLRWILLMQDGGFWSDIDILYSSSMDNLTENTVENSELNVGLCPYSWGDHAIGFLFSSPQNRFFNIIHQLSQKHFHQGAYQSIGSNIFNGYFRQIENIKRIPDTFPVFMNPNSVYFLGPHQIDNFYNINVECVGKPGVIGHHWYAGAAISQQFEGSLTIENYKEYKNTISGIINHILEGKHEL